MDDAVLNVGFRKCCFDCLGKAGQIVRAGYENVLYTPILQIEIVVNLHHAGTKLAVHKDCAAATEHVNYPRVLRGEQLVNKPEQFALAANPAQKAFLNTITSRYEKSAASLTFVCQKDGAAVYRYLSMSV